MTRRITTFTADGGTLNLWVTGCFSCGVVFAMTEEHEQRLRASHNTFYCPNGHTMWFKPGKSDEQKLKESAARETALKDQLSAAIREGDAARQELLRTRQRIANGVCPCCTRSFPNVLAHMTTEHPDFALPANVRHAADVVEFRCSCGGEYETYHGLRVHQGKSRYDGWDDPDAPRWSAHLAVI